MDLNVNGARLQVEADPAMPLLWVLRDVLQLTGTKFGCGIAACGACTVRVDGQAVRSCVTPVGSVGRQGGADHRRAGHRRQAASAAGGLDRRAGAAMRLLPERHADGGRRAAGEEAASRPTPTSTRRSPTSAAAAPTSACAPRSSGAAGEAQGVKRRTWLLGTTAGAAHCWWAGACCRSARAWAWPR